MRKSLPVAWAVRTAKVVLGVLVVLVVLVAADLMVLMLRVEIRKAIARNDQQLNRLQFRSVQRAACVSLPVQCDSVSQRLF